MAPQGGAAPRPSLDHRPRRRARWIRRAFAALPTTIRAGFALLGAGAVADAAYHLVHGLRPGHTHATGIDLAAVIHLLVVAGMLVTLAGLIHAGIRSAHTPDHEKEAI